MVGKLKNTPAVVTLDRGFIMVARMSSYDDHYLLTDCFNLRQYNTGCGYGNLTDNKNIVLDKFNDLKVPEHSLLHFYEVSEETFTKITAQPKKK